MTVVNFRCDTETEALLASLAREGENRSDTIRRALRDADKLRRRDLMRAEAASVVDDPHDRAEMDAVRADLDALRAW